MPHHPSASPHHGFFRGTTLSLTHSSPAFGDASLPDTPSRTAYSSMKGVSSPYGTVQSPRAIPSFIRKAWQGSNRHSSAVAPSPGIGPSANVDVDVDALLRRRVRERDAEWAGAMEDLQITNEETKDKVREWELRAKEAERAQARLARELEEVRKKQKLEKEREDEEWRRTCTDRTTRLLGYVGEMATSNRILRDQLSDLGVRPDTSRVETRIPAQERAEPEDGDGDAVNSKRRGIIVTRSSAEAEARQFFESAYTKAITNDDPFEKQLKQKEQGIQVTVTGIWQEIRARNRDADIQPIRPTHARTRSSVSMEVGYCPEEDVLESRRSSMSHYRMGPGGGRRGSRQYATSIHDVYEEGPLSEHREWSPSGGDRPSLWGKIGRKVRQAGRVLH